MVPKVVTHSPPHTVIVNLHPSFERRFTVHKPYQISYKKCEYLLQYLHSGNKLYWFKWD